MQPEKYTDNFRRALEDTQNLVIEKDSSALEPAHLLHVLLADEGSLANQLLAKQNVASGLAKDKLEKIIDALPSVRGNNASAANLAASRNFIKLINRVEKYAKDFGDEFISPEWVLPAIFDVGGSEKQLLTELGVDQDKLLQDIKVVRGEDKINSSATEPGENILEKYTINLTEQASKGELDPVIGRDEEIRRAVQVVQRRRKNNPVLIGEPGVGKTAIVEGLAQRVVNREVPQSMQNKEVLALDMGALLSGTKFRGEFEERVKSLLKELNKRKGEIILFIDELHTLVGAGRTDGAMDAGNMLKPALARGDLHCIGATTLNEYRKYIEKDPALERRFQKVFVGEPTSEDTVAILRGLKEKYEVHHGVDITDSALLSAVNLSVRYISDRRLPDKAIDLIDEAASRIRMEIDSKPERLEALERELIKLKIENEALKKEEGEAAKKRLKLVQEKLAKHEKELANLNEIFKEEKAKLHLSQELKSELDQKRTEKENATRSGDLAKLAELQYGVIPDLEKRLAKSLRQQESEKQAKADASKSDARVQIRNKVTENEIAEAVASWTGIPVARMLQGEKQRLLNLEKELGSVVIGQKEPIAAVANTIRRFRAGIAEESRPNGSFLFLGPTGVGKTETCRALAEFMFDSRSAMVRLDMSEYMEKHSVARLVGAPPGYVGHEEGGQLTEAIRRRPYSLILLDEVEKAHPDVFNILLQVLEDGRLTDSQGRTVDFSNSIIVMTSNLGSEDIRRLQGEDYDILHEVIMQHVGKHFRPEFINRIDEIVVFGSLQQEDIKQIADLQIQQLAKRLDNQYGIKLQLTKAAVDNLCKIGYDEVYGARPLKRAIQKKIENLLATKLLSDDLGGESSITIDFHKDFLVKSQADPAAKSAG